MARIAEWHVSSHRNGPASLERLRLVASDFVGAEPGEDVLFDMALGRGVAVLGICCYLVAILIRRGLIVIPFPDFLCVFPCFLLPSTDFGPLCCDVCDFCRFKLTGLICAVVVPVLIIHCDSMHKPNGSPSTCRSADDF